MNLTRIILGVIFFIFQISRIEPSTVHRDILFIAVHLHTYPVTSLTMVLVAYGFVSQSSIR